MDSQKSQLQSPTKRKPLSDIGNTIGFVSSNSCKRQRTSESSPGTSCQQMSATSSGQGEKQEKDKKTRLISYQLVSFPLLLLSNCYKQVNVESKDFGEERQRLLDKEKTGNPYLPSCNYLKWHPHLTSKMRAILLDWMFEVAEEYSLHRHTTHLAVNFVDRFLTKVPDIPKGILQLVGITGLFLASKIEESNHISSRDLAMLSDETYSAEQIHNMEAFMAKELEWKLQPVTPYIWAKLMTQNFCATKKIPFPKKDFFRLMQRVDFLLLHYESLKWSPSVIAASAFCIYFDDVSSVETVTGHQIETLIECKEFFVQFFGISPGKIDEIPEEHLPTNFHEKQSRNPEAMDFVRGMLDSENQPMQKEKKKLER